MEAHFRALGAQRAKSGFPLFLLEHGLTAKEVATISHHLRDRLRTNERLGKHWLLWAIYATERGYDYTGHEYWQSFEDRTPYWQGSDRNRLSGWFRKFRENYDAVVPTGQWASQFRIIAWPITHAILPKYLQHQFARSLWELKYRLATLSALDARSIGHLVALHAHGSNRFEEFLQQEELTGRIVLALLGQHEANDVSPIHSATLQRIVGDLEEVRRSREWLREARQVVQDRFSGIGRGAGPREPADHRHDHAPVRPAPSPSLRPAILLRSDGMGSWTALLDVPDFRVIAVNAAIREFLRSTRVQLAGSEQVRASGWLLGARRRAVLENWPEEGTPLVRFEEPQPVIDHIIEGDCLMRSGPNWLFRIGVDDIAREISGRVVRPGGDYLLVGSQLPQIEGWIRPASMNCRGVEVRRIAVPANLSSSDVELLSGLNLQVAKTIRVWPAGLPGRAWDGEGNCEWLTTEAPCLGLMHDHPVDSFVVRVGDQELAVSAGDPGSPSFIRLSPLPAGVHRFHVRARRSADQPLSEKYAEPEGHLVMRVREPEPWRPGRALHSGLVVTMDPLDPDFDTVWDNQLDLSVLGPEGHQVRCEISMTRGDGTEIFSDPIPDPLTLPVTPAAWRRCLDRFSSYPDRALKALEASAGCLVIKGDELGEFRVHFERDVPPLRWLLHRSGEKVSVRLADDTGLEDQAPTASYYAFGRPLEATELARADVEQAADVVVPGGLFVASLDTFADAVAVSSGRMSTGLDGLGIVPTFPELQSDVPTWQEWFRVAALWREARLAGFLADARREQVINGFYAAVYRSICGSVWADAEERFLQAPTSENLEKLQQGIGKFSGFGVVLRRECERLNSDFSAGAEWFAGRANHYYQVDLNASRAALRFASDPQRFAAELGEGLAQFIDGMRAAPTPLRAARFLALLCANPPDASTTNRFPGWSW